MTRLHIIILIVALVILSFLVWLYYKTNDIDIIKAEYEIQMDKYDIHRIENVRKINEEIMKTKTYLEDLRSERETIMQEIDTPPSDILDPQLHYTVSDQI